MRIRSFVYFVAIGTFDSNGQRKLVYNKTFYLTYESR